MDGDDYKMASSLLSTSQPLSSAPPKRAAGKAFLYDANGKRLKGAAAAAAELLNDQRRYATKPEDQAFFREHVWREAATGVVEGSGTSTIAGASQGHVPHPSAMLSLSRSANVGGNGVGGSKPDMFDLRAGGAGPQMDAHVSHRATSRGSTLALEREAMMWSDDDSEEADGGDGASGRRGSLYDALPPLHQWLCTTPVLPQRNRAPDEGGEKEVGGEDTHPSIPTYHPQSRWKRADELLETEALLTAAASQSERRGMPALTNALSALHLLSLCASGDSVTGSSASGTAHADATAGSAVVGLAGVLPAHRSDHDVFSFFTFTDEEYLSLQPPSPLMPPRAEGRRVGEQARFCFDLAATRKLFTLYERFGSFLLVADRWDTAGSTQTAPTVEDICEEHQRVTQGVLMQRMRRLQEALMPFFKAGTAANVDGGDDADPTDKRKRSGTRKRRRSPLPNDGGVAETLQDEEGEEREHAKEMAATALLQQVNRHPLMTLALKHPFLRNCEGLLAVPPAAALSNPASAKEDGAKEPLAAGEAAAPAEADVPPLSTPCIPSPAKLFHSLTSPSAAHDGGTATEGTAWYRAEEERQRRRSLRQLLQRESEVNVPYQRVAAAYLSLVPKAGHALRRLQALVQPPAPAVSSPFSILFERFADPAMFDVPLRPLPEVDPALWQAADAALRGQPAAPHSPGDDTAEESRDARRRPGRRTVAVAAATAATAAADAPGTLESTLSEVFQQLPVTCTRLMLAAQAGWLLPPPEPLATGTGKKWKRSGSAGHGEAGNDARSGGEGGRPHPRKQRRDNEDSESECTSDGSASTDVVASSPSRKRRGREEERRLLAEVAATGVCNRCCSMISESVLMTLPQAAPRLHKEAEEDLEKYLWEDATALMDNSPLVVSHYVPAIRLAYTQNVVLKRLLGKLENYRDIMVKLEAATAEALSMSATLASPLTDGTDGSPAALF